MTDTSTSTPVSTVPTPGHILHRMSMPVLLFSAVFATALGVSRFAILPTLTSIEVGGVKRDAAGLQRRTEELKAQIADVQKERDEEILTLQGTPYRALVNSKISGDSGLELLEAFRSLAREAVPGTPDAVVITQEHIDGKTLTLKGDVSGVGPGSMTVLAQFTEILRGDTRVASLVAPTFTRLEDPKVGPHSPFTIVLTLQ